MKTKDLPQDVNIATVWAVDIYQQMMNYQRWDAMTREEFIDIVRVINKKYEKYIESEPKPMLK